jgi:hypothetical protein
MSEYQILPPLSAEAVAGLKEIYAELNPPVAKGQRVRMGANIGSKISCYKDTRWFKWSAAQRKRFKDYFDNRPHVTKALVGYFIEFPKNCGYLDTQTTWVAGGEHSTIIVAYALNDGQSIIISDKKVTLNAGEGISFRLSKVHEVKKSKRDSLWANTMVLGKLEDYP